MRNKKIIIAGGTGFIGQALAEVWGKDNAVIILSRRSVADPDGPSDLKSEAGRREVAGRNNSYDGRLLTAGDGYNIGYCRWDGRHVERHWAGELEGADLVINLAGRSVNCRYTARNRQDISDSRADATRVIGQAIREAVVPPKLWVNGGSATIYRHAEDRPQDEYTGEMADDFSVRVCKRWERTFEEQRSPFTRKIALRLAITLGRDGPMVPYLNLVKFGLGGPQGSGRQMFSWVHIDDVARAMEWFVDHPELEGTYNLSSPSPVTNRVFMSTLRHVAGRRIGLGAPALLLRLGTWLLGTETELLLKSRWVVPTKLLATGFRFRFEQLEEAFQTIVVDQKKRS
jgi:uncharacterized protein (TIGR01777 family)